MKSKEHYRQKLREYKCCILIPTFNNDRKIAGVLKDVLEYTDQVIVVNDGSTDDTKKVVASFSNIHVIGYPDNKGKGSALRMGFAEALRSGYQYTITIDSDGQHRAEDIPVFIDALEREGSALIIGSRNMNQSGVPGTSNFGHRFSNFWYKLETGISLPDTQSGFRLYPLKEIQKMKFYTTKYEFELEVLVKAAWKRIKVIPVPINVVYPEDRITHFRIFTDFARISILNSLFVLWAFLYVKPAQLFSQLKKENRRAFIQKNILLSTESNGKITLAAMLGLFIGVAPIWGYQIIAGIALAHLFRLSKVLVVAASHISIPPMIPLILFASVRMGGWMLGNHEAVVFRSDFNFEAIKTGMLQYVAGSLGLGVLLALVAGAVIYFLLLLFRRKPVTAD